MKIGHYLRHEAPFESQELCSIGTKIWEWNYRSHGDDDDIIGYRHGRFYLRQDQLWFDEVGKGTFKIDYVPVKNYIEFVD